ncbi:diguanylate cyclase/phosphodiesterase with PAS/PAC sensor(s) [Leptothrix cholodnii SP-6]|uniref:Diguanylate cyclase/phosphodiesterase with PAS/PAC sensor(S) n=1 Tax=Leptothrix cholodnii (strain ATCC 51168 / LMG 8142 / SP-6) TaxID=395495 RepID=B1Y3M1_LEPCP|nr:bifunctional diguanylate cyclase/phosphodiesterase [Leptothrix cholodnii]ACB35724.1 diguanylate cyclase/phosphodiesterase with PAS/PAC sensor(s) [Leptothrix cholodnii SP-6]
MSRRVRSQPGASRQGPDLPAAAAAATPVATEAERRAEAMAHELQVHRIELEMQNDELRRAQIALETARDRYIDLYDFAPVGYFTLDTNGLITEANLTGADLLGEARAKLVGRRFERYIAPVDRDRWHRHALSLSRRGEPGRIELLVQGAGGRSIHAQLDGLMARANHDAPLLRIALTDISERKHAESELRLAATAFEAQEGMMITDAHGVIERVNKAFTQMTGYSAAEAIGQTARLLHSGRHDPAFYAAMWDSLQRTGTWQGEVWNRRKCGEVYAEWLTITAVQDEHRTVTRYVGTMLDISQRKAREEEIAQLAFYDPLTGLPNRRLLKDRLNQAMAISARSQREGALLFIDLDHFKDINDTRGHDKGDLLLQNVAQRLSGCVREGDTVARIGGDEFVVMLGADLSTATDEAASHARSVAEKILAALNLPYLMSGEFVHCSASLGVALFNDHHDTVDELLKRADQAMYQAKAGGRNTLRFFDTAVQQTMMLRAALEAELRLAVQRDELVLCYQPVIDHQNRLLGAEALVRWKHPRRGLVSPAEFIPIAEDRGLIQAIGRWVLETACTQLATWAADPATADLVLSVNVSARELHEPQFVERVIEILACTGARPARLKIELTENAVLDHVDDSIAKMKRLKAHGIRLALDDFGTGHGSLSLLKRLPLDELKIDRTFVQDLLTDTHDAAIARTIAALGLNLGISVVAEGVETPAQRDLLIACGCRIFQGDLFGPPAALEALARMAMPK